MSEPQKVHHFKVHDIALSGVTVFNDRAEIKRTLKVQLVPGINEVLVENVTKSADTESIRVDGRGPAVIHDVQFQHKPTLPEEGFSPKVQKLEEERKTLKNEKEALEDRQKVLERRAGALDAIVAKVGGFGMEHRNDGEPTSFVLKDETLESLTKLLSFYEDSSLDIRKKLRELNEEIRVIDEKLAKLGNEIGIAQNEQRFARHISVLLESTSGGDVELDISYQVWGAKWFPRYDVRIDEHSSDEHKGNVMKLTYYGIIEQHTGEDWIDVPLVLSTAQPSLGGNVPELGTQIACLYKPQPEPEPVPVPRPVPMPCRMMMKRSGLAAANATEQCEMMEAPMAFGAVTAAPVAAGDTVLSAAFAISRPTTIPSDLSEHKVTITLIEMKPTMLYEAIPSKNTNAFLTASVLNSSHIPFLPGQANIYLNNSFVCKTNIKSVSPNERFSCSLGVDTAIKVEYKPAHKYSEQVGILAKASSTSHEQRIVIKNRKSEKILITVKEHVPKSTDEKIKIKLFSPELDPKPLSDSDLMKRRQAPTVGAVMNASHNLEWTVSVEPNQETELLVKWSVDYPNGETIEYREEF